MKLKIQKHKLYIFIFAVFSVLLLVLVFSIYRKNNFNNGNSAVSSASAEKGQLREIDVVAKQFDFSPNPIKVKFGERVRLNLTSSDVVHGFSLPDFGIEAVVNPGKIKTVEFTANKRGTFTFRCSIACGIGHSGMRGTLIVE